MSLIVVGLNHRTAPVTLLERMTVPEELLAKVLHDLCAREHLLEVVVLSTCNRIEVYARCTHFHPAVGDVSAFLADYSGSNPDDFSELLYTYSDEAAVAHLFAVAAGLDSMIVGEAEIQGQVKRAYELALAERATGPIANRLFREALGAGKRVRTETGLGRSRVSVSSVAVELAADILGDLSTRRVLVIGAGENGELTARALRERGVHTVFVANRHYDRAIGLAERFDGAAVRFDELPEQLAQADIVVSCTASPHQIVDREELELTLSDRPERRLVVIDIAVPRDFDPAVRDLQGVALYDMDDLQRAAARNRDVREAEAKRARSIIGEEVDRFDRWLASLDVVPTIAALRDRGDEIVKAVLAENESRWESLSEADRERMAVMARAVVGRMLHEPTLRLKGAAEADESHVFVHALRELFGLERPAPTLEGERPSAEVTELDSRRKRR